MSINGIAPLPDDSFDSSPDTAFNKGAAEFLKLVETAVTRADQEEQNLKFESLALQMLDLDVHQRIPTTEAINQQGWNFSQILNIWTVPTTSSHASCSWNDQALDHLGGKGTVGRIWHALKTTHQTGFPKRVAGQDLHQASYKRRRLSRDKVSNCVPTDPAHSASPIMELQTLDSPAIDKDYSHVVKEAPSIPSRTVAVPGRKSVLRSKITWWLKTQEETDKPSNTHVSTPRTPQPSSSRIAVQSPKIISPTSSDHPIKKRRGRKPKRKFTGSPSSTPPPPPCSSLLPTYSQGDASPKLHTPTNHRAPSRSHDLTPVAKKTLVRKSHGNERHLSPVAAAGNGFKCKGISSCPQKKE